MWKGKIKIPDQEQRLPAIAVVKLQLQRLSPLFATGDNKIKFACETQVAATPRINFADNKA